ncbi:DUF1883 domain-containing protein [Bradyrhizobium sp. BWA-3-5]|uniref:DUF1883 domain-containing protein n=1 Tax=Bradyrhizobium sp. BWA-3-5 TaxID=3080013 RepID=UPI00293E7419|nr:DUF1883 domain-containing protein [Bradyrhizobium sp. BWA-3-5]WOH64052.1 DUF1883 domain-containing protein [Bradyrhizobium sp. BWA-3-5]WOH64178.1 DUF1883 domain-containing protein [Bradyrhizobium sp. BWA-3-5]WOH70102.1 DUF1883 domain-containing protein [Bradyrhizobium sp. BWA-3-5]
MADFIHTRELLHAGDVVVVQCSHQCNVRLTDDSNFQAFRSGRQHRAYGGFFRALPARVAVPHDGYWNVTIDLAGGQANIRYSISYLKAA